MSIEAEARPASARSAGARSAEDGERILTLLGSLASVTEPGRAVDQLTHSLQAAARAERDGADDELVVAALCHDIGHVLPVADHAAVSAELLDGHVRPDIVSIVSNHTQIAEDASAPACVGRPWLHDALRFVAEWDLPSYDPAAATPRLDDFRSRVLDVFSRRHESQPVRIDDLIGTLSVDEFRAGWFGRRSLLDDGRSWSRFDRLLDLATTEQLVLRHHRDRAERDRTGRPRARVEVEHTSSPVAFEVLHRPLDLPEGEIAVFDIGSASTLIAGGARVSLHVVDELVEALAATTASVASSLGRPASMSAVATWQPGRELAHRTPHHLWVLHLAGARTWTLRTPSNEASEVRLSCGDALYIPAGWDVSWSDAGSPSLHVVLAISERSPEGMFEMLRHSLGDFEAVREDLPLAGAPPGRGAHAERLRLAVVAALGRR